MKFDKETRAYALVTLVIVAGLVAYILLSRAGL